MLFSELLRLITRMRMKVTLLLLLLTPVLPAFSQVFIRGMVTDSATHEPLPFCSFIVKGTAHGGVADGQGQFTFRAEQLPVTLVFSMTGYRTKQVTVRRADSVVTVKLASSVVFLAPVTITSERVQTWHAEDAWTFRDFAFYDDLILALVSMQGRKGDYLVLLDTLGHTVSRLKITRRPDSLYTDCLGAVHLCCGDSIYQVYYDYEKLSLPYVSSREKFVATMLPCRCQLGPYYYFSFTGYHGQKVNYYYINWYEKGNYQPFLAVHDSARIVSFNENYDIRYFLVRRKLYGEYEEPVDSIVRHMDEYREQLPLSDRETQWLAPVASPLVRMGANACIVDPLDSLLLTYTGPGRCVDSSFFYCMRMAGWQNDELYADATGNALYGRTVGRDGISVFVRIDPHTGKALGRVTIEKYPYLTQPLIRGGYAYFLWKDPYSEQPVKLRVAWLGE